ncbi:MAG TPA: APC family permease [Thermoleophilia bacterium]|nr:APC family permease [Thermoleophilia bacterium]
MADTTPAEPKGGQGAAGELFVRRASGLTRTVSPWSALVYAFVCPTMTFAFLYYYQEQTAYVGALGWATSFLILLLFPIALIYVFMSLSMPRSGGEYIYVSRILHPLLGFIACWTLTIVGINWSGLLAQWAVNWGLGNLFLAEGLATGNQTLVDWGKYLSITTPEHRPVIWLLATAVLASAFIVMALGTRAVMKAMWVVLVTQWVMLVTFIVVALVSGGESNTIAGFEKVQGIKWTEVTDAVKTVSGGAGLPAFAVAATVWAGLVWVNLSTLGSTYAANISGEIKKVNTAMPLSQIGSMLLFFVYWIIFTLVANYGLGDNTIRSLSFIDTEGTATTMLNTVPLISYQVVWMTQNWLLVAIAGPLGFLIATWGGVLGLSFAPVRNLFAFSFDGLLPGWVNKVSRNGSPNHAVLLAFLISWAIMTVSIFTTWWSFITYTVTIWMVGWVILGIAAMVFPYVRKDIFEKSPALVQSRVAGIPWITILGAIGTAVAALSIYATFLVGTTPTFNTKNLAYTSLVFILAPIVIYFIATTWQKSKGVEMDKRFKTIPPD